MCDNIGNQYTKAFEYIDKILTNEYDDNLKQEMENLTCFHCPLDNEITKDELIYNLLNYIYYCHGIFIYEDTILTGLKFFMNYKIEGELKNNLKTFIFKVIEDFINQNFNQYFPKATFKTNVPAKSLEEIERLSKILIKEYKKIFNVEELNPNIIDKYKMYLELDKEMLKIYNKCMKYGFSEDILDLIMNYCSKYEDKTVSSHPIDRNKVREHWKNVSKQNLIMDIERLRIKDYEICLDVLNRIFNA